MFMYGFIPTEEALNRLIEEVENRYSSIPSGERAYFTHVEVAQLLGYDLYVNNADKIEAAVKNCDYKTSTIKSTYPDRCFYNDFVTYINNTVNRRLFDRKDPGLTRKHAFTHNIEDRMDFATGTIEECFAIKLRANMSYLNARIKLSEEERDGCLDGEWWLRNIEPKDFIREMTNSFNKFFGYNADWRDRIPPFDEILSGVAKKRKKAVAINPATTNATAKAPIVGTVAEDYDKLLEDYNALKDDYAKQEQKYNDKINELKDKLAETEMNLSSANAEIDRLKAHIASISVPTVTESEEVASLKRKLDLIKGILEF